MKKKTLLLLPALGLILTGCANTGPLPTFGKAIEPQWITADFDGVPGDEYIATNNLQDVVFNGRGEVIAWYVKNYAGTPYIRKTAQGYDFSVLKNSKSIVNMVGGGKAFAIEAKEAGLDSAQSAEIRPAQLTLDEGKNEQRAIFEYQQGGVTVRKTLTMHPRNFKMDIQTRVKGDVEEYEMVFPAVGNNTLRAQALADGQTQPAIAQAGGTVDVKNMRYAAIQEQPSQVAHALIVQPQGGQKADVRVQGGVPSQLRVVLRGSSNLEVYGGKNELIHLYQSGYAGLPGLFSPNWFGRLSLGLVKLMELLYKLIGNWGLVIIALTVLVRLIMWPLMQSQMRTSTKMQYIQPKQKEITERYQGKTDIESQRAMQAEIQALYKEHDINPMGCLSTFLPFPVLIALWSTIRNFEFDKGFLWLPDLAIPDPFYILAALYMIVNLAQLYIATRKSPEMFRQQVIMYVMFLYLALTFPAGVTLYAVLSALIGIVQQLLINKQVEAETARLNQSVELASMPVPGGAVKAKNKKNKKTLDAPKDPE